MAKHVLPHTILINKLTLSTFGYNTSIQKGNKMGNSVKLQKNGENGRYNITIPKAMVESKGWKKGDEFEIEDIGLNELRVTRK
jgi:hypothetical protein